MRWTAKNAKNRGYKRLRKTQLYKLKGRKRVAPYFYAFRGLKGTGNITHSNKCGEVAALIGARRFTQSEGKHILNALVAVAFLTPRVRLRRGGKAGERGALSRV